MFFLSSVAFYQVSDNEGGYFHSRYGHRPQCNWASIFLGGTGSVHCLTRQLSLFLMSLTSLPRYLHSSLAEREKDVQFRFCLLPLATDPAPVWIGEQRSQRVFRRETEEVQHCSYFQCALFCTPIWLPCLFSCLLWFVSSNMKGSLSTGTRGHCRGYMWKNHMEKCNNISFCFLHQRAKQRLLYNLLDAMQSNLTQAAVVGLSCRLVCAKFYFQSMFF